jgi:F0F1-type ATP synthase assembly protein I
MPNDNPTPVRKTGGKLHEAVKTYVQVEKVGQIALVLPSAVLIGWLGGVWLDSHFHQSWMTLTGFLLGCVAGMTSVIRMAMTLVAEPKKNDAARAGPLEHPTEHPKDDGQ